MSIINAPETPISKRSRKTRSISFPDDLLIKLQKHAKKIKRSPNWVVVELVKRAVRKSK